MTRWLKQLQQEVADLFFPRQCIGCGKMGDFICSQCSKKLPRLVPPVCQKCGRPETSSAYCPGCRGKKDGIDFIRSVFIFEGVIRDAIHAFKYHNLSAISSTLAAYMYAYMQKDGIKGDILIPVPLHERRIHERGYNQSELLAKDISHLSGMPLGMNYISRVYNTEPQVRTSSAEQRKKNVENAFGRVSARVEGLNIIIIDDVCTSGATLSSCSGALKKAGARQVVGLTLAREI